MSLQRELANFIVGQQQLAELETLYPNVLTYEMFSTLLLLLTAFFVLWFIRLLKLIFDISDLSMAIRAHHLSLIHIVNFDLLESLWAQGNIRSYISLLFSQHSNANNNTSSSNNSNHLLQHVKSPNLKMESITLPIIFPLSSVTCISNQTLSFEFIFPIQSNYSKCGVQCVWNLQQIVWKEHVLLPFLQPSQQEAYKSNASNSTTVQLSNHKQDSMDWLQRMNIDPTLQLYSHASTMQWVSPSNQTIALQFPIHSSNGLEHAILPLLLVFSFLKKEEEEEVTEFYYGIFYFQNNGSTIRLFKHCIQTNQMIYLLQDVYGHFDDSSSNEEECCVICLSEPRQVTLLPCRHLCVCHECFAQIDKCPICRISVNSFIQ